uniref:Ovule protein n=1 Tax=Ascaris lumbricoides TaxID=6252 RepID=A0A0M3HP05_ASCLU
MSEMNALLKSRRKKNTTKVKDRHRTPEPLFFVKSVGFPEISFSSRIHPCLEPIHNCLFEPNAFSALNYRLAFVGYLAQCAGISSLSSRFAASCFVGLSLSITFTSVPEERSLHICVAPH